MPCVPPYSMCATWFVELLRLSASDCMMLKLDFVWKMPHRKLASLSDMSCIQMTKKWTVLALDVTRLRHKSAGLHLSVFV